jgi:tRNA dimethylallyltransferase
MPLDSKLKNKIIFLVGPTAVGKTETAAHLARKLNAEVISCDSMQIYKNMDIITSKPPSQLTKKVPYHLIDMLNPAKEYNVSRYRKDAMKKISEIAKRGKIALFVGGAGLYMSILIDGLFKAKAKDSGMRKRLYSLNLKKGSDYLHEKLKKIDPEAAAKIHPNDTKRIVRALEVFEITGKPISKLQKQRKGLGSEYNVVILGLNMDKDALYKRIDSRVEEMFQRGLVSEVKGLLKKRLSRTARFAIGIKELRGYFGGLYDLEEAKRLIKRNTRRYAKRQLAWFRKDKRIHWINMKQNEKPQITAKKIWNELC